jgi:hypothetical protein
VAASPPPAVDAGLAEVDLQVRRPRQAALDQRLLERILDVLLKRPAQRPRAEPRFDVMMMMVFLKSTVSPSPSVAFEHLQQDVVDVRVRLCLTVRNRSILMRRTHSEAAAD